MNVTSLPPLYYQNANKHCLPALLLNHEALAIVTQRIPMRVNVGDVCECCRERKCQVSMRAHLPTGDISERELVVRLEL